MHLTESQIYAALNSNPLAGGQGTFARPLTFGQDRNLNMQFIRLARGYQQKLAAIGFNIQTAFEQELQLTHKCSGKELTDEEYASFIDELYCRIPVLDNGKEFTREVNQVAEVASPPKDPLETSALFNILIKTIRSVSAENGVNPIWHRSDMSISIIDESAGKHILDSREHDERAGPICGLIARAVTDATPIFVRQARFEKYGLRFIDAGMTRIRAMRLVPDSVRLETRLDHNPLQGQHMIASFAVLLGAAYNALTLKHSEVERLMDKMQMPRFHDNLYWFDDQLGGASPCFFFKEILNGATVFKTKNWNFDLVQVMHYDKPQFLQKEMGYRNQHELHVFLSSLRVAETKGQHHLVWSEEAAARFRPEFIESLERINVRHPVSRFFAHRMNREEGVKTPAEMIDIMASSALLELIMGKKLVSATVNEVRTMLGYDSPNVPPQSRRLSADAAAL